MSVQFVMVIYFKIETLIGIVWQCKDCGCMYQDMSSKESKRGY
ncbi:hypothetical protein RYE61_16810 [Clostridioides difficile]|nr:hypothetical protein [Clostridioides difficile]